jgi:hypothetical protein
MKADQKAKLTLQKTYFNKRESIYNKKYFFVYFRLLIKHFLSKF